MGVGRPRRHRHSQFFYGTIDTDFGRFANLADQSLRWFQMGYHGPGTLQTALALPARQRTSRSVTSVSSTSRSWSTMSAAPEPNAWGLKDMVGNVSEWTRSSYRPYLTPTTPVTTKTPAERKVARGGSWADRPADAGQSVRRAYAAWQKVHDVGFRVIVEDPGHRLADPVPGSLGSPTRVARTR